MKHYKVKSYARQAGMTLIELSVVLLILVGLAGLLVPYVGSFTQKTHDSTNASNITQLNNATGRFISEKNRPPAHISTLINHADATAAASGSCVGATAGAIYCGMLDTAMFTPTTYTVGTDDVALASIAKGGFSMLVNHNPDTANKTFNSETGMVYLPGSPENLAGTTLTVAKVAASTDTNANTIPKHLSLALGGAGMDYHPECYDYVAFGIGDKAELIGNTMQASPVHFPENAELGPVERYNHYVGIFQVDKSNTATYVEAGVTKNCSSTTERAKFLGVAMNIPNVGVPGMRHLYGAGEALGYAYNNMVEKQR